MNVLIFLALNFSLAGTTIEQPSPATAENCFASEDTFTDVIVLDVTPRNARVVDEIAIDFSSNRAEQRDEVLRQLKRRAYIAGADAISEVHIQEEREDRWLFSHKGTAKALRCPKKPKDLFVRLAPNNSLKPNPLRGSA